MLWFNPEENGAEKMTNNWPLLELHNLAFEMVDGSPIYRKSFFVFETGWRGSASPGFRIGEWMAYNLQVIVIVIVVVFLKRVGENGSK